MAEPLVVVGAVITRGGRILVGQRRRHLRAGGKWEFPGGKVQPGEHPEAALRREIIEELAVLIEIQGLIDRTVTQIGDEAIDLSCYRCRLTQGEPSTSSDHDLLHWLRPSELIHLTWCDADLPTVHKLSLPDTSPYPSRRMTL